MIIDSTKDWLPNENGQQKMLRLSSSGICIAAENAETLTVLFIRTVARCEWLQKNRNDVNQLSLCLRLVHIQCRLYHYDSENAIGKEKKIPIFCKKILKVGVFYRKVQIKETNSYKS